MESIDPDLDRCSIYGSTTTETCETAAFCLALRSRLLGSLHLGIPARVEDRTGWNRRREGTRVQGQRIHASAAGRNVDRAPPGLSAGVRPSVVISARSAVADLCGWSVHANSWQPAQTLLFSHARPVFHWRRKGESRSAGDSHRSVQARAASVIYGGDHDVLGDRPRP